MNLNNVSGYIAKSAAKVAFIYRNSNTCCENGKYDNWIVNCLNQNFQNLRIVRMLKRIYFYNINIRDMATEEWDTLSEFQKNRINESLAQAEGGLGEPAEEVIERLRKKY